MKREKWLTGEIPALMTWGQNGDSITEKKTGRRYYLIQRESDGWLARGGENSGGVYKFTFAELASEFTDPDRKRIRAAKEKERLKKKPKVKKERKHNHMIDLF